MVFKVLDLSNTKFVVNKDAFINKGNRNQDFSDASVLSGNTTETSYDAVSSRRKRNSQMIPSDHAAGFNNTSSSSVLRIWEHMKNTPIGHFTRQPPPPPPPSPPRDHPRPLSSISPPRDHPRPLSRTQFHTKNLQQFKYTVQPTELRSLVPYSAKPKAEDSDYEDSDSDSEYSDEEDSDCEDTYNDDSDEEDMFVRVFLLKLHGRRETITIVEGINKIFNHHKILRDLREEFGCNGRVVMDSDFGKVIELFGDQRRIVACFLVEVGIVKRNHLVIHGFL